MKLPAGLPVNWSAVWALGELCQRVDPLSLEPAIPQITEAFVGIFQRRVGMEVLPNQLAAHRQLLGDRSAKQCESSSSRLDTSSEGILPWLDFASEVDKAVRVANEIGYAMPSFKQKLPEDLPGVADRKSSEEHEPLDQDSAAVGLLKQNNFLCILPLALKASSSRARQAASGSYYIQLQE
ncbi:Tnpo1 [Symbiodinium sp. CCMP2456]|nr:Tnpo1 [Symbiodinium sp. CCMP2456]